MKNAGNNAPSPSNKAKTNAQKPEVRDNLDSRGDLELNDQPSGHNKKELHKGVKNEHNDPQGRKSTKK